MSALFAEEVSAAVPTRMRSTGRRTPLGHLFSEMSAALLPAPGLAAFPDRDGGDYQRDDWVSPVPAEQEIEEQPDQQDTGQVSHGPEVPDWFHVVALIQGCWYAYDRRTE